MIVKRIFRAEKMIKRIVEEGRGDMLDQKTLETIYALDGEEAEDYNWQTVVNQKPLAIIKATEKHPEMPVNIADCD